MQHAQQQKVISRAAAVNVVVPTLPPLTLLVQQDGHQAHFIVYQYGNFKLLTLLHGGRNQVKKNLGKSHQSVIYTICFNSFSST